MRRLACGEGRTTRQHKCGKPTNRIVDRRARYLARGAILLALVVTACSTELKNREVVTETQPSTQPLSFRFALPDGTSVGDDDFDGRSTVILFLTTYDTVSQAIARRLDELSHRRTPRINVLAVALEPPQNAPLVSVYRSTLALSYPVAMADGDTLEGRGAFGDVRVVPALVLLDERVRIVRRGSGVDCFSAIESVLMATSRENR